MKNLNINKLSKMLQVAPSTVSRIMSGNARKYRISEKTEKKVLEKAAELGFKPNYLAHSLNTGRTYNIGMLFANRIDSFLGSIMEGVESVLRGTKYQMVVATCENNPELEKEEIKRMLYRQVDGIIVYPSAVNMNSSYSVEHFKIQETKLVPYVVIGRKIDIDADFVLFSDYEAGKWAAEDFLAMNCRNFAMASSPMRCSANLKREEGFTETLLKNNVPRENITIVGKDKLALEKEIEKLRNADCIFGINSGLLEKYALKLSESKDISSLLLRGLGENNTFSLLYPNFRAKFMPAREMGVMAARILLEKLENPNLPKILRHLPWDNDSD